MKRVLIGVSLVLVMAAVGYLVPGHTQGPAPRLRLANATSQREINDSAPSTTSSGLKLRWHGVGVNPLGIAFDGANIWTANLEATP